MYDHVYLSYDVFIQNDVQSHMYILYIIYIYILQGPGGRSPGRRRLQGAVVT